MKKLVKEYINEKFIDDSDPISDMGIGGYSFNTMSTGTIIKCNKSFGTTNAGVIRGYNSVAKRISQGTYFVIFNIQRIDKYYISFDYKNVGCVYSWFYKTPEEIKEKEKEFIESAKYYSKRYISNFQEAIKILPKSGHIAKIGKNKFENMFKIIGKGDVIINESLNERFEEESDPVWDMGIGDPLMIAGGFLQRYAEKHGYTFGISKKGTPYMDVPTEYFRSFSGSAKYGWGTICKVKYVRYTITLTDWKEKYSLRKIWYGHASERIYPGWYYRSTRKDEAKFKSDLKTKKFKIENLEQVLLGRARTPQEIMKKLETNIPKELKKNE